MTVAPDIDDLLAMAETARAAFPAPFAALAAEVRLVVTDWPDEAVPEEMDVEDSYELTGLYEGEPLTERSLEVPSPPSTVFLFRR
ncbi:MAG: metallopeptidase family protein, partial [Jannaschia sp.]